jgi:hypothetical protein
MRHPVIAGAAAAALGFAAASASAQSRQWDGRGFVSANGGYQATTNDFQENVAFTAFAEQGDFDARYQADPGPVIDISGAVRVWRGFAVGGGITSYNRTSPVDVTAHVPHPFFFDRRREATGTVSDVKRTETAVHVDAMWVVPVTGRVNVAIFGGPSYFALKQPIVESLRYNDVFPYDTISIEGANTTTPQESKLGYNAGADVMYMFTRNVGVGGVVRFAQAQFELAGPNNTTVKVTAGGAQAGAGVRLGF